jgi:MFS family permease
MGGGIVRTVLGGALGDPYGRRKVFAVGVALFPAASVLCGCSPDIRLLIIARDAQEVGGKLLVPSSLALISANFSHDDRGRAIGTWSGFHVLNCLSGGTTLSLHYLPGSNVSGVFALIALVIGEWRHITQRLCLQPHRWPMKESTASRYGELRSGG